MKQKLFARVRVVNLLQFTQSWNRNWQRKQLITIRSGSEEGDPWVPSGAGLTTQLGVSPTGEVARGMMMTNVYICIKMDFGMILLVIQDVMSFVKEMLHSIQRQDLQG